jgi:ubiquinone/menaquinone biosynthesis C-methylase UbiE
VKPETVALLCDPSNHEPLQFVSEQIPNDGVREWLVGSKSGHKYPIRDGIAVFLGEQDVTGANKKYQTLYNRIARFYDVTEKIAAELMWGGRDKTRREILRDVQVRSGDTVLEVSIGTGVNLRYLPADASYFGLDISAGMLKQCQRNLRTWNIQAELFQGIAERLPFQDCVFDVVYHFGGINYFTDKASAIAEMVRVAKPGARICVGDETEELSRQYEKLPGVDRYYRSQDSSVPVDLVPAAMLDVKAEKVCKDKFYMISFRKP